MSSKSKAVATQPKRYATSTQIRVILDENVGRIFGSDGTSLQEPKSGLHEYDDDAHDDQKEVIAVLQDHLEKMKVSFMIGTLRIFSKKLPLIAPQ